MGVNDSAMGVNGSTMGVIEFGLVKNKLLFIKYDHTEFYYYFVLNEYYILI